MRYSFTSLLDHCTDLTLLTAFMRTVLSTVCSSRKPVAFMTPLRALLIDHTCHIIICLLVSLLILPLFSSDATLPVVVNVSSLREGLDQ